MPFARSKLSLHAEERLASRFKIGAPQFVSLLNSGQGKRIGRSSRNHLIHRLLWSHVDQALLVAVQDDIDGTILTVLSVEMYCAHYERNITESRIRRVVNQMVHAGLAPCDLWTPGDKDDKVTIYASMIGTLVPLALGSWKGTIESHDLSVLGCNTSFWEWVVDKVLSKGHNPDHIERVTGRFSGGNHQAIRYQCLGAASTSCEQHA